MKNNHISRHIILAVTASCLVSSFSAMAAVRTAQRSYTIGNDIAGANGTVKVTLTNNATARFSRAEIQALGTVRFLKSTHRGMEAKASVENRSGSGRAQATFRVLNYYVDSGVQPVTLNYTNAKTVLVSGSMPVPGFEFVTLSGSAKLEGAVGYKLGINLSGVSAAGFAKAKATGTASAQAGALGCSAALTSRLAIMNTRLDANCSVSPWVITPSATLTVEPVDILLQLTAGCWGFNSTANLAHYSAGRYVYSLF